MSRFAQRMQRAATGATGLSGDGYPDAATTGYRGSLTPYDGSPWITAPDTVFENYHVSERLSIDTTATNVVIRNCLFDTGDYYQLIVYGTGALIEDCTFIGQTAPDETNVTNINLTAEMSPNGSFTARRCDFSGAQDAVTFADNCKMYDCYLHDLGYIDDSHNDNINVNGHIGVEIVHNTILNAQSQTSCATLGDATPGHTQLKSEVLFQHNKVAGGGYAIYGGAAAPASQGIRVVDNVFSTQYFPGCGSYGVAAYWVDDGVNTWSGNTWYDGPNKGQPVALS